MSVAPLEEIQRSEVWYCGACAKRKRALEERERKEQIKASEEEPNVTQ